MKNKPATEAVQTETVILPDGTATVVPKSGASENAAPRQRKVGKMEAAETKEVKTEPRKEN